MARREQLFGSGIDFGDGECVVTMNQFLLVHINIYELPVSSSSVLLKLAEKYSNRAEWVVSFLIRVMKKLLIRRVSNNGVLKASCAY